MSVASLGTLAAVRDVKAPTRSDIGKVPPTESDADESAKIRDLLVAQVPTEVVVPYTAVSAAIVGAIATDQVDPDEYLAWRWLVFGIMLGTVAAFVWIAKQQKKTSRRRFPLLEISGGVVAAAGWALILPESPIIPYIDDEGARTFIPVIIGFVAVMITAVIAAALKSKAGGATTPEEPGPSPERGQ